MKLSTIAKTKRQQSKESGRSIKNPVAKYVKSGINKAITMTDRKKAANNPRKSLKHKSKMFESLFEGQKVWTKDEIRAKLETDDRWVLKALMAIYKLQTDDEKTNHTTSHQNSVGFSGVDAEFLTQAALKLEQRGGLTPKHLFWVRKKMLKYSGQLAKIANGTI